jgi:hypothetical protein
MERTAEAQALLARSHSLHRALFSRAFLTRFSHALFSRLPGAPLARQLPRHGGHVELSGVRRTARTATLLKPLREEPAKDVEVCAAMRGDERVYDFLHGDFLRRHRKHAGDM